MNYPLIVSIASLIIAASALFLAWQSYRLNRKLPNENKLFEEKFKSYRALTAALNICAATHVDSGYLYENHGLSGNDLDELEESLDEQLLKTYVQIEDTLAEQLLVIPDEVLEPVEKFIEMFNHEDFLEEVGKTGKTAEFAEQIWDHFDDVMDAMREDLSLEKLDAGLQHRIGAQRKPRRLSRVTDSVT